MKRIIVLILMLLPLSAIAHVGSPDVFFEGEAGPYRMFVTVRTPRVIPGIATIEIRSEDHDVSDISVVPMRLTGPGSQLPPTADPAERSDVDPQFFTASVWLMERGSLQVRITARGARGEGKLAVPVPAVAQQTLAMTRGLGGLLLALMAVIAFALIGIVAGAFREAALEPDVAPSAKARRRGRIVTAIAGAGVVGLIMFGNAWWNAEAANYERMVVRPWRVTPHVEGCHLAITMPKLFGGLLPDHGHEMHLFLVRVPDLDRLVHLHPQRGENGDFAQTLPSMAAGTYRVFADIVIDSGFPVTGTAELALPDLACPPLTGDDAAWTGTPASELGDGARMIWDRPPTLRAGVAMPLKFRVVNRDGTPATLEPYMGMAGHAEVIRTDGSVFAHLHPSGSVAMPALELANAGLGGMADMAGMGGMTRPMSMPSDLAFPYGFPQPGAYRIFVQVKHAGQIVTGAFDARVD